MALAEPHSRPKSVGADLLVGPGWLESLLANTETTSPPHVVLEVFYIPRPGDAGADSQCESEECVPGAVSVHPSYFEAEWDADRYYPNYSCARDGNLLPDERLCAALAGLGICEGSLVVVYGKGGDASPMFACRAVWALMYAGVQDVRLLDGGMAAWRRHGGRTAALPRPPVAAPRFGAAVACRRQFLATTEDVAAISVGSSPGQLLDVRRPGEFDGSFTGAYTFFHRAGHIPGARYLANWDEFVDLGSGKLRDLESVRKWWSSIGLTDSPGPLVFYCGTGWRSTIAFVLAYMLGLDARNYDDSFYGWCEAERPVNGTSVQKDGDVAGGDGTAPERRPPLCH